MTVHPRWRGEHFTLSAGISFPDGSSPLARGTPGRAGAGADPYRFIPAGAGNTHGIAREGIERAVHPRWRGEHVQFRQADAGRVGSSPLARGTLYRAPRKRSTARFIPAGAGNTIGSPIRSDTSPVHPRWRGEHTRNQSCRRCCPGSSPLARGTHYGCMRGYRHDRFIPAGAGNTGLLLPPLPPDTVHPRWRGEHPERQRAIR